MSELQYKGQDYIHRAVQKTISHKGKNIVRFNHIKYNSFRVATVSLSRRVIWLTFEYHMNDLMHKYNSFTTTSTTCHQQ